MDDGGREVWLLYYMSWLSRRAPQSSRQHLGYQVGIACRRTIEAWRQKSRWGSRFLSWKHIWDLCTTGGRSQLSHQLFSFLSQWISWHAYASLRFCSLQPGVLTDQFFFSVFPPLLPTSKTGTRSPSTVWKKMPEPSCFGHRWQSEFWLRKAQSEPVAGLNTFTVYHVLLKLTPNLSVFSISIAPATVLSR